MTIEEAKVRSETIPLDPSFGVVNGRPSIATFIQNKDVIHHPNIWLDLCPMDMEWVEKP